MTVESAAHILYAGDVAPSGRAGALVWYSAPVTCAPMVSINGAAAQAVALTGHGHAIGDTTGLQGALDGKAAAGHTHAIGDTTGLQGALDGKAAAGHTHAIADTAGLQTAVDGKQPLAAVLTAVASNSTGPGCDEGDLARNADLGSAAFLAWSQVPVNIRAETVTANRTLVALDHGKGLLCTSAVTLTLPAASDPDLAQTWNVRIKNRSGGSVTLQRSGSDTLNGGTSVTIADGAATTVVFMGGAAFETF